MLTWEFVCSGVRVGPTLRLDSASQAATGFHQANTSTKTLPRTSVWSSALPILAVSVIPPLALANLNVQLACWQTPQLFSACNPAPMAILPTI